MAIKQGSGMLRPIAPILWMPLVAGLTASFMTLVVALTDLRFAIRSEEGRISLETAQAIVAGLVAYLIFGRAARSRRLRDELIATAFTVFTFTSILFVTVRLAGVLQDGSRAERVAIWAPLLARTVGAALLAVAAWIPLHRRMATPSGAKILCNAGATVTVIALGVTLVADRLPSGIAEELLLKPGSIPGIHAHPALQVLQLILVGFYAAAAWGLMAHPDETGDAFGTTLATGFVAAAFARLNFYLYPSIYSDVVHIGDLLRLMFYAILLVGVSVEIQRYWQVETDAAAMRERQRLARELHDGLTQELSFIRSQTAAMANGTTYPEMLQLISASADRAVSESRSLLVTLRGDSSVGARDTLAAAAHQAVGHQATVQLDVPRGLMLTQTVSHELSRIVGEASSNACKHGTATAIEVRVTADGEQLKVVVTDNGTGFDLHDQRPGGHGLVGMQERAELLGGSIAVRSHPGRGTTLEVTVPHLGQSPGVAEPATA